MGGLNGRRMVEKLGDQWFNQRESKVIMKKNAMEGKLRIFKSTDDENN